MYSIRPNLYIGFHGCDESSRDKLIMNPHDVEPSKKLHDWLGNGFYIWENNYSRALQWAYDKEKKKKISIASVVGVVYTLSNCLDFTDSEFIDSISEYYYLMKDELEKLPENKNHNKKIKDKRSTSEPSSKYSFFQMGTVSLSVSMAKEQASNAAFLCGAATAITTAVSPISSFPMR